MFRSPRCFTGLCTKDMDMNKAIDYLMRYPYHVDVDFI